ncbi:hypothetical protein [Halorhabdus sp. BNX81]|uniref:DUF7533 family protein n=1 Tax=Halorhabdus sp. BNX81 TaxID=2980181 RepID=UPI0023DD0EA9|nr:hypothetical protein [Halorhabdus sp. BNX81]WEL20293.1 putative membrane protein [Halorhabdus sp. BNX81]
MAAGILETVSRVGTALVVAPIAVLGLDFLVQGQTAGGLAFLGIVGLILALERYVITPREIPQRIVSYLVGSLFTVEDAADS